MDREQITKELEKHIYIHHIDPDSKVYQAIVSAAQIVKDEEARWEIVKKKEKGYNTWHYECSNCHEQPLKSRWNSQQDALSSYCPHCGKKMQEVVIPEEFMDEICF